MRHEVCSVLCSDCAVRWASCTRRAWRAKQHTIRDNLISHLTEAQCKPALPCVASHRIILFFLFRFTFLVLRRPRPTCQ